MLSILTLIHVVFSLLAIGSGAFILFGLLTGRLFAKWAVIFLKCSLFASLAGLFFPFQHLPPTHGLSMLSVYLSGAVVLAWRKYHLAGVWRSVFALTATIVLYLNGLAFLAQVFQYVSPLRILVNSQPEPTLMATRFLGLALFVALGVFAARRFRDARTDSL